MQLSKASQPDTTSHEATAPTSMDPTSYPYKNVGVAPDPNRKGANWQFLVDSGVSPEEADRLTAGR